MSRNQIIMPEFQHTNSLYMNGTNQYLRRNADVSIGIGNAWTIAYWVKPSSVDGVTNQHIHIKNTINTANSISISRTNAAGTLSITINNSAGAALKSYTYGTSTTLSPLNSGRWQFIVFTWDGTTLQGYYQGDAISPTTTPVDNAGSQTSTNRAIAVGATTGGTVDSLGYFHSFGIWSTVLTAAEIFKLYAGMCQFDWRKIQRSSLQHYWLFGRDGELSSPDLGVGTAIDLTIDKGPSTTVDIRNQAPHVNIVPPLPPAGHKWSIDFDGTNNYLANSGSSNTGPFNIPNSFTVMYWVKPTEATFAQGRQHFLKGAFSNIEVSHQGAVANDPLRVIVRNTAGTAFKQYDYRNLIVGNVWQQIVLTWDSTTLSLYKDGSFVAASTKTTDNAGQVGPALSALSIGANNAGSTKFKGRISQWVLWGACATSGEVTTMYNGGNGWNFDCNNANQFTSLGRPIHWFLLGDPLWIAYDRIDSAGNSVIDLTDNQGGTTTANCVADYPGA